MGAMKGHEIASCPYMKDKGMTLSTKKLIGKEASKRQAEKTSHKNKHRPSSLYNAPKFKQVSR
jgi:hypothetical protein